MGRTERAHRELLKRWTSLAANRASLADAVQQLANLRETDAAAAALAQTDAELLSELDDRELATLLEIARAVERLEAGTFGRCTSCGEEIESTRLEVMPWTPTCFACAESREKPRAVASPLVRAREQWIAGPRTPALPWNGGADAGEDPLDVARRALEETTEAPALGSELAADYPADLIYEPDELLHDHLQFGEAGELDDALDSSLSVGA